MTAPYKTEKIESLEGHIEDLQRQKGMLQDIEKYTDRKVDFGDIIETHQLVNEEISKLQGQLKNYKAAKQDTGKKGGSPQPLIEHIVRDEKGRVTAVSPEYFHIDNNPNVKEAFKVVYEMSKNRGDVD